MCCLYKQSGWEHSHINHYCHIQEFSRNYPHLPISCNKTQISIYHNVKQDHSQERVTSLGALAGLSPWGSPPWPKWSSQGGSITPFMVSYAQMMFQEWTVPSSGINILIFLNNAKWFWKKKMYQCSRKRLLQIGIVEELQKYY